MKRDRACPLCGEAPTITSIEVSAAACANASNDQIAALAQNDLIDAVTLRVQLASHNPPLLIDVRSESEAAICRIAGSRLVPLSELPKMLDQLPRDARIVLHCKSGQRSAQALQILNAAGFRGVQSLAGGILAWIDACDPALIRY